MTVYALRFPCVRCRTKNNMVCHRLAHTLYILAELYSRDLWTTLAFRIVPAHRTAKFMVESYTLVCALSST